ncbi:hypothetical protein MKX01_014049 [Papaver californicum]|nr:hypothetical protein MKX01_014049 [Papaver californicum]
MFFPNLRLPKIFYKHLTHTQYDGAMASFRIYNPYVNLNQYSTSQMWNQNGASDSTNNIEAGWVVSH